jgi:hypothetical protein
MEIATDRIEIGFWPEELNQDILARRLFVMGEEVLQNAYALATPVCVYCPAAAPQPECAK